jgi:hypothetical protein
VSSHNKRVRINKKNLKLSENLKYSHKGRKYSYIIRNVRLKKFISLKKHILVLTVDPPLQYSPLTEDEMLQKKNRVREREREMVKYVNV